MVLPPTDHLPQSSDASKEPVPSEPLAPESVTSLGAAAAQAAAPLAEAITIMARLRGPGGCPWDHEQTFDSIKKHTLEETYEVFDAIERRAWPELKDELGDLLLPVVFFVPRGGGGGG